MADLTRKDILKLAALARISLTDDEAISLGVELKEILKYVEMLYLVDTTGLSPTSQVTQLTNVTRPDEIRQYGYPVAAMMSNVPHVESGHLKVKRMIG